MRFKCVSNLWLFLITSRYLTNLFLKSCSSPQRSFAYFMDEMDNYAVLASSAREHSDTSVSVINQVLTLPRMRGKFVSAVRGLACFTFENRVRVCNISTRQVVELPPLTSSKAIGNNINEMYYFGHDTVNDEYKVLSMVFDISNKSTKHQVLVLGAGASWRKIQCHIPHVSYWRGMTINGVLYYVASTSVYSSSYVLMSVDLNSEEFKLIELPNVVELPRTILMNYKEKIVVLEPINDGNVDVWVLEDDAEKNQWLNKKTFVLPYSQINCVQGDKVTIGGTSHRRKVWLAKVCDTSALIQFFTYDLERNEIAQRIEITTSDIFRTLGRIEGTLFLLSLMMNWFLLTFWDDSESVIYLEI